MQLQHNYSLQSYNTFGIEAKAENFTTITSEEELQTLLQKYPNTPIRILGGGSNILLTHDVEGIVIKNNIRGIDVVSESENTVVLGIGAGEVWHEVVLHTVAKNWGGIENLSLIPGTCGAAPIQNIGAYGVELKDVFVKLEAVELHTGKLLTFQKEDCQFGYRNSVFKNEWKGRLCITKIYLALQKAPHDLKLSYGAITKQLDAQHIQEPTVQNVSDTIIAIRQSKLPDPKQIGNSGSFFKNPEINTGLFKILQKKHSTIPNYPLPNGKVKIPAAWLIDQCGFKGKRYGNTGCYTNQPLVLVNYGEATGGEILAMSRMVQKKVQEKFNIRLHPEVNIW